MARPRAYTRETLELALDIHVPGRWFRQGSGYTVRRSFGPPLHLVTLRDAWMFVNGLAEAAQQARAS